MERYYLGMITDEGEVACVEEHLLWCHRCLDRIELIEAGVDMIRMALVMVGEPEETVARRRRRRTGK